MKKAGLHAWIRSLGKTVAALLAGPSFPMVRPSVSDVWFCCFRSEGRPRTMARVSAWHSVNSGVHHVCTNCNTGNNIERENRRPGTGGKPLCKECRDWIRKRRC